MAKHSKQTYENDLEGGGQGWGQQGQQAWREHQQASAGRASYGYAVGQNKTRKGAPAYSAASAQYASFGKTVIDDHRKRTKRRWRVIFWLALVVLVVCLSVLGYILYGYWTGQQNYNKAEEAAGFEFPRRESQVVLGGLKVDWDALRAINPDVVAWVYFPGTNINYPVVQGSDNNHYLKYDFYGGTNAFVSVGAIFLDSSNTPDFSDVNNVVYGHHLNDGTMFSALAGLSDQTAFDESRTVYVLTPTQNYKLRTFALVHVSAYDPIVQTSFATPEDQANYVQDKIDRSVVSAADVPETSAISKTFAFSTCDNSANNGRYVLFSYVEEQAAAPVVDAGSAQAGGGTGGEVAPEDAAAINEAMQAVEGS